MTSRIADSITSAVASVVGSGPVALHEPSFTGREWEYLKDCLDSTFVSSVGKYVDRFESELADFIGVKHVVAVVNGTAALQVALRLAGVEKGDEVIVPALSFVATANAVSYCGAVPHFADSDMKTLGMDPDRLREYLSTVAEVRGDACYNRYTGRLIRALVPVHTFGHPVEIHDLQRIAKDYSLTLIEDAAESLGSTYGGKHAGTFGLIATLSFNGNKTITTGGGGAILTNDSEIARAAKHLTTTAKIPHRWEYRHDQVGFNYRMPNLNAALGCAQLEQLPAFVESKRQLFELYEKEFVGISGARMFREPPGARSNYWLQTLILDEAVADQRDEILRLTNDAGLMTRPAWVPMNELAPYGGCPKMDLTVAEALGRRVINLPSSPQIASRS